MSLLTDGKIAGIIGRVAGGLLGEAATLHKRSLGVDANFVGVSTYTDTPITCTPNTKRSSRHYAARLPDGTVDVLFYQYGALANPVPGDQFTYRGVRHEILTVEPDPANATWDINGRPL